MKNLLFTLFILLCIVYPGYSQKPDKAFAKEFCTKMLTYLKNHDTTGFLSMWTLRDDKMPPDQKKEFNYQRLKSNFGAIWNFLDTALKGNYPIEEIEINEEEADGNTSKSHYYLGTYNIKMWFKYSDNYRKGIGFHMDYIHNKWVSCCWDPDQSWIRKPDPTGPIK